MNAASPAGSYPGKRYEPAPFCAIISETQNQLVDRHKPGTNAAALLAAGRRKERDYENKGDRNFRDLCK